jgi:hypothetical protein
MISAVSVVSAGMISAPSMTCLGQCKMDLVALGLWGIMTGRGWVVVAVRAALQREDLRHA